MNKISPNTKLADIILENETLIPILSRFGIHLGIKDKSIKDICKETAIQKDLLICVIKTLVDPHFNPTETLQTFSVLQLVDYLKKENQYFLKELEIISIHIDDLICLSDSKNNNLLLLKKIFSEYKQEMNLFFQQKEEQLFPHIISIYEEYYSPIIQNKGKNKKLLFPDNEAELLSKKLSNIKLLIIKDINGEYEEEMLFSVLLSLSKLEKEINVQKKIENHLLKTIVSEMEESILKAQKRHKSKTQQNTYISISSEKENILTPREIDVLKLAAQGYINKEIAEKLQISLHTVISHRKNIAEKLSIKNISGLTVYAMMNGLI